MHIRPATIDDLDALAVMGEHFLQQTEYAAMLACSPVHLRDFAVRCVTGALGQSDILVSDTGDGTLTGMIGLMVAPHPFSGERVAGELFWWVEPAHRGHGVRLLRAGEAWARAHDAVRFQMVAPNARVGHLYRRLGFAPLETTYQRTF